MPKFRDIAVGDTFDFISPDSSMNSFYARCVKLSARTYTSIEGEAEPLPIMVGSINAKVYHVEPG